MKTIRITKDIDTYYQALKGNVTYVLEKNASITSSEYFGLAAYTGVKNRDLVLKGDVSSSQGFGVHVGDNNYRGAGELDIAKSSSIYGKLAGVNVGADNQVVRNAGKILGDNGMQIGAENVHVRNTGSITGKVEGIDVFLGTGTIRNDGLISGEKFGIYSLLTTGDHLKIVNNGTIVGGEYGIVLSNGNGVRTVIVNNGEINAKYWAISANASEAVEVLRNRGDINAPVGLYGGNDTYDGRGGRTAWSVDGGKGNDLYIIDDPLAKLSEQADSGIDTVRSSVTWTLGANFEDLILTGKNSIAGTGTDQSNHLTGNEGENTLFGMGGVDILNGGKGNDTLNGGAGADHFVFVTGTRHDTIADFQDTIDLIDITGIKGISTFAQIEEAMTQVGADVVIDLGGKDRITVENITIDKLTAIDFAY
ncbi:calcium-binding protein [Rhizobium sp.]